MEIFCKKCNNKDFYTLKDNRLKCKKCGYKFSQKKDEILNEIILNFVNRKSALSCSKKLNLSYKSVQQKYKYFKEEITRYLDLPLNQDLFNNSSQICELYYFTNREKLSKNIDIFNAISIIVIIHQEYLFTFLAPLNRYDDDANFNTIKRYIKNKNSYKIESFWQFMQDELLKYRGIKKERFIFFLKECEFKFNFSKDEQIAILKDFSSKNKTMTHYFLR